MRCRSNVQLMTLDADIAPLVDAVNAAAAEAPPIDEQTVADRRAGYAALSSIAGPGPQIESVVDSEIAGVPVRTYRNGADVGVFVYIHGGGFTIGDLDTHDPVCRQLCVESAATVVSIDYRLAPEHPFPAGINDAWAVLQAIHADRAAYGDDTRIVVGGDSAGGTFAAALALLARDAEIDVAAQLLIYPSVDAEDDSPSMTDNGTGYILTADTMRWFGDRYQADATDFRASPIRAESHKGVAPALIITAQYDPLRDQGAAYARVLEAAGVDVTYANYDGMVHAFFQLSPIVAKAKSAIDQVAKAARSALRE